MKKYCRVAGISHARCKAILEQNGEVQLTHERDNEYDPLAIRVDTLDGQKIGYVAKTGDDKYKLDAEEVQHLATTEPKALVSIVNYFKDGKDKLWDWVEEGDIVQLLIEVDVPTDATEVLRCAFSKEKVWFDKENHIYTNKDGRVYTSGSEFAGRYESPFDATRIAEAMAAKHKNITAQEIVKIWDHKSKVSCDLGTTVHEALEMYGKYKDLSLTLKGDLSYALHDNPLLNRIVKGFYDGRDDEVARYEVFVADTEGLLCGSIDRLLFVDERKKSVRVQDFKVNTNILKRATVLPPFKGVVENSKLGLYWLQLSFYATLLERKGYTVEGLDIFWFNGDEWITYSRDVVDIEKELN